MKIGFTERGDAGLDLSWEQPIRDKKVDGAILITKQITGAFTSTLLKLWNDGYHNLILHCTCTGWGNTIVEPNVPHYWQQLKALNTLIQNGFPKDHCVLRIDPIWPTPSGINRALDVLHAADTFPNLKDIRLRISVLDEYTHVKKRIRNSGNSPIYGDRFYAPKAMMQTVNDALSNTGRTFECCAEPYLTDVCFIHQGCLSNKDLKIMGLKNPGTSLMNRQNRAGCMCLPYKTELLKHRHPCPHNCMYCYWKD